MEKIDWQEIEYKVVLAIGVLLTLWMFVLLLFLIGLLVYCGITTVLL